MNEPKEYLSVSKTYTNMDDVLGDIDSILESYLKNITSNKKNFAEVSEELRRQSFSYSKSKFEEAVLDELQHQNMLAAMRKTI
ncbi:hypothetical protein FH621_01690 [Latilactobacillus curvatus]|uniref:hypothetical protein n=1 Tax=Latilactobacillus curvatus TaxID=28038 RepID=UPI00217D5AAA|nr:hypothetical protein [Latilactobacillus curvatus]MCS6142274.1 hypothetical protein [Latilactobacillus curvatus]